MADNSLTPKEEFLLNPVIEHNITDAAIATFETNLRHGVKVEVPFTPKQDLHGYDHPWPAGGSVNLIPDGTDASKGYLSNGYLNADGTTSAGSSWYVSEYFPVTAGETYTWSSSVSNISAASTCFYDENKQYISGEAANRELPKSLVAPENAVYCRTSQYLLNNQLCQIEKGNTASPIVPYKNICPISGWTGIKISDAQNILSNYRLQFSGTHTAIYGGGSYPTGALVTTDGDVCGIYNYIECKQYIGKQLSINFRPYGTINGGVAFYDINKKFISGIGNGSSTVHGLWTFSVPNNQNIAYLRISCQYSKRNDVILCETEKAQSALINWQSEAGTIYGGMVTLNEDGSADLVDAWKFLTLGDCETFGIPAVSDSSGFASQIFKLPSNGVLTGTDSLDGKGIAVSDKLHQFTSYFYENRTSNVTSPGFASQWSSKHDICLYIRVYWPDTTLTTASAFKAAVANVNICYLLHDPTIVYHFPNIGQLKTFLGVNNIWSDIGNVNVKYLTQNSDTGMEYRGDRALELRRRAMIADAPTIHTTTGSEETGGLASFKSYVKAPVKKIEIPFKPKQDLHGMDHPYPAGVSVNLIPDTTDTENGYVAGQHLNVDGTTTANANWYISEYITLDSETTYTWSNRANTNVAPSICFYDENKVFISGVNINKQYSYTFTPPEGTVYCRSSQTTYAYQEASTSNGAFQLEVGSTATPYQRYSNICPIEGINDASITHTSKNILDDYALTFNGSLSAPKGLWIANNGAVNATYGDCCVVNNYIDCSAYIGKVLRLNYRPASTPTSHESRTAGIAFYNSSMKFISGVANGYNDGGPWAFTVPNNPEIKYLRLSVQYTKRNELMLVARSDYLTYPIVFTNPSTGDPMTVYGGTVTLNEDGSADVVANLRSATISGSKVYKGTDYTNVSYATFASPPGSIGFYSHNETIKVYCDRGEIYRSAGNFNNVSRINQLCIAASGTSLWFGFAVGTSEENMKTTLDGTQIVYELATPTTYHFDNIGQLKTFLGENNFWCDISDDITVKYWNRG